MDRAAEYDKRKKQRIERRKNGECTKCGVPLSDVEKHVGFVTCSRCRYNWRMKYYPISTRAIHARPMCERGMNGECWCCGELLPPGYAKRVCQKCIDRRHAGRKKR